MDTWAPSWKQVVGRVVSWALVIAVTIAFVSEIFTNQSIALVREDIDEANGNNINTRFITESP